MSQSGNLKIYKKPLLKEYGDIKKITKGSWGGGNDGIPSRGDESA